MASQQQASNTPAPLRDRWQTPQWLFDWAERNLGAFDIDLAASALNTKCDYFFDIESNALSLDWTLHSPRLYTELNCTDYGWCNPPYSETGKWLKKAWEEAQKGYKTVFLVPTPNGENHYRDFVFGKASEIIFINGRVSFELPNDNGTATPVNGNTRGSCLIVFGRNHEGETLLRTINRDDIRS